MKTIKPFRLSVLPRPYLWRNQQRLGIAVMALADLSGKQPVILPDLALWKDVVPTLDADEMIDMFIPKATPEFLVSGNAYTRHQKNKTSCMVRIETGGLLKDLRVTGNRSWINGRSTAPEKFDAMPIIWANAYGGPACENNPSGKGAAGPGTVGQPVALPNIEDPLHPFVSPGKDIPVAGFGPISFTRPDRQKMMGTYSESWLKQDFPGFFSDMDPAIFNIAATSQHWPDRQEIPLGQDFSIWNMTPDEAVWRAQIPNWHARCFVTQSDQFREVPMQASTVWFLPERKQILLIYHGSIDVKEDDALDITHLMPALEMDGAAHPIEHYRHIMQQRSEPIKGGLYAFRDFELVAPLLVGKWLDSETSVKETQMWQKSHLRRDAMQEEMRRNVTDQGLNPDDYFPIIMGPEREYMPTELPELMEQTAQLEQTMQLKKVQIRDNLLSAAGPAPDADYVDLVEKIFSGEGSKPKGPPKKIQDELDVDRKIGEMAENEPISEIAKEHNGLFPNAEQLRAQLDKNIKSTGMHDRPGLDDRTRVRMEKLNPLRQRMYLYSAQFQDGVARVSRHESEQVRQDVLEKYHAGRDLRGLDLTGQDLSGLQLSGADFSNALMEGADLSGCRLDNCNFSEAVLTRARLHETVLSGSIFSKTNLSVLNATGCTFDNAHITEAIFEQSSFEQCSFQGTIISDLLGRQLTFNQCDFRGASFDMSIINELNLSDCNMAQMAAFKVSINDGTLAGCCLHEAHLDSCMFFATTLTRMNFDHVHFMCVGFAYQTTFSQCSFRQSHLKNSNFRDMDLSKMDFSGAYLDSSDFSNTNLSDANLRQIRAAQSMFIRSDLQRADLTAGDLMHANFKKANLRAARMDQVNLFRANMEQIVIDDDTALRDSYTTQANIYPLKKTVEERNR